MDMNKKQFDFEFVPANTVTHMGQLTKKEFSNEENQELRDKFDEDLGWWEPNPLVDHTSLLIAYAYGQGKNIRDEFNVPEEKLVIGDSGGYEILTGVSGEMEEVHEMKNEGKYGELKKKYGTKDLDEITQKVRLKHQDDVDPIEVMDWFQDNVDIGMTLDFPPVRIAPGSKSQSQSIDLEEFERRAEFTAQNTKRMCEYMPKEERNFSLYNIIHTKIDDPTKMDIWWDKVKDFDTDGWATSPKVVDNPMYSAYILAFLRDKGVESNIHMLGVAGLNSLPVIAYMSNYMDNITTDSFSYGMMGLRFRKAKTPNPLGTYSALNLPSFSFGKTRDNTLEEMPCMCPACEKVNDIGGADILDRGGSMPGFFVALHNLYQYKVYCEVLRRLKKDEELLLQFVRKNCDEKTEKAIKFIDYALETNPKIAHNKFSKAFGQVDEADSGSATSLDNIGAKQESEEVEEVVEEAKETVSENLEEEVDEAFNW